MATDLTEIRRREQEALLAEIRRREQEALRSFEAVLEAQDAEEDRVRTLKAEIERLTARLQTAERTAHEWRERAELAALTLRERVARALVDCSACGDAGGMPVEHPATLADLARIACAHGVDAAGLCEREAEAMSRAGANEAEARREVEAAAMARATPDETHG